MSVGRRNTGTSKDWGTPGIYAEAVRQFFNGKIGLDPCGNEWSVIHADLEFRLDRGEDGLAERWTAKTIYVNPPYGRDPDRGTSILDWIRKCHETSKAGSEVVALVPVATNTRHWKNHILGHASVCFLRDTRLKFLERGVPGKRGAPMACAFVYWGQRSSDFKSHFGKYGYVITGG